MTVRAADAVTAAREDYLAAIYRLQERDEVVATGRIAAELAVSDASVTNMLKQLHRLGLVEHLPYHGVHLTDAGKLHALSILRRHRLLEHFLVESLGFSPDSAHDEADRLEHYLSPELTDRLDQVLGGPPGEVPHKSMPDAR